MSTLPVWRGVIGQGRHPPAGYVFVVDDDGALLTDDDGAYLLVESE
jgi:hypothetical protein